jgi:predicted acyltransferase
MVTDTNARDVGNAASGLLGIGRLGGQRTECHGAQYCRKCERRKVSPHDEPIILAPIPVPSSRLVSLDVFRGATMAAMVLVNNPGDWSQVYAPLLHAEWHGWTPTDLIFPFFVFIVGVSVTLSQRTLQPGTVILRRAALIFALGLLLALYPRFDVTTVRVMGVLQRLALCYLAAAWFYRWSQAGSDDDRWQGAVGVMSMLLIAYWGLMHFVPPPGGVAGDLTPSGNLGAWLDRTIFGEAHLWRQSRTWDPEGLLGTIPAIASALSGIAAGVILTGGRSPVQKVAFLLAGGGAALAMGLVWDRSFPINKSLWTSSYVLFTSGLASMGLAACYWLLDVQRSVRWIRPFVVLGTNALLLFVLSGLLVKTLLLFKVAGADGSVISVNRWLYVTWFEPFASPKNASLLFAAANLLVLYVPLEFLYRRRWFLRV